jgi:5-(carboxyamino)imidazole ribonucleotide mutase
VSAPRIAIVMGGRSDESKLGEALQLLDGFGVTYEKRVLSAHRSPESLAEYVREAPERGIQVFICAAGMAAHLAGAVAASTHLPVIGLPVSAGVLQGLDALLATVQMPPGVPVATVAVDGAKNAAILAVQMLALSDPDLAGKLVEMKRKMAEAVSTSDPP